jgi:hypothetical protein
LLKSITRKLVVGFCLDHGDSVVARIVEQVVCAFLRTAFDLIAANRNDAPISEAFLLEDRVFVIVPTSSLKPGRTYSLQVAVSFTPYGSFLQKICQKEYSRSSSVIQQSRISR